MPNRSGNSNIVQTSNINVYSMHDVEIDERGAFVFRWTVPSNWYDEWDGEITLEDPEVLYHFDVEDVVSHLPARLGMLCEMRAYYLIWLLWLLQVLY
jgi:hypothetical protein